MVKAVFLKRSGTIFIKGTSLQMVKTFFLKRSGTTFIKLKKGHNVNGSYCPVRAGRTDRVLLGPVLTRRLSSTPLLQRDK